MLIVPNKDLGQLAISICLPSTHTNQIHSLLRLYSYSPHSEKKDL